MGRRALNPRIQMHISGLKSARFFYSFLVRPTHENPRPSGTKIFEENREGEEYNEKRFFSTLLRPTPSMIRYEN